VFLGIDPGLVKTGWGIIECSRNAINYVDSGVIQDKDCDLAMTERLVNIFRSLSEVIERHLPTHCAIEHVYVNTNYASSLKLSQARAACMIACGMFKHDTAEYPAKTIKKTLTGNGNADKHQVMNMVKIQLRLTDSHCKKIRLYDEYDALAIALCHTAHTFPWATS